MTDWDQAVRLRDLDLLGLGKYPSLGPWVGVGVGSLTPVDYPCHLTQGKRQIPSWEWPDALHVTSVPQGERGAPGICFRLDLGQTPHSSSLGCFCCIQRAGSVAGVTQHIRAEAAPST